MIIVCLFLFIGRSTDFSALYLFLLNKDYTELEKSNIIMGMPIR